MSVRIKTEDGDMIVSGKGKDGTSGIPVPQVAEVGQILAVKAVDSESKPIEWEVVNRSGGGDVDDLIKILRLEQNELPYGFYQGSAVVLNDEIHILGGTDNAQKHYKYNGTSWESLSTLPYSFYQGGSAVVLNDEIHILGGIWYGSNYYKYNGASWEYVSRIPYTFLNGSAVVLNDEIHILGTEASNSRYAHYKYNGTSWESVSELPYGFYQGSAVVLNDEIHILGGTDNGGKHYKYNGTSWESVSNLPYGFYEGSAVVLNDEIHILGTSHTNNVFRKNHYKYNGTSWESVSELPYGFYQGSAVVLNERCIGLLGGSDTYFIPASASSNAQKYCKVKAKIIF